MEGRQTTPHDDPHAGRRPPPRDPFEDAERDPLEGEPRDPFRGERQARGYSGASPRPPRGRGLDLSALFVLLDGMRRVLPRELEEQFTALVREVLLTLRALIDWYLERLDGREREPRVEDIPIE
jgi:hypothetical protein